MLNCKNILVLSPHTDDSELGAGGLISKLVSNGSKVTVMLFSNPIKSLLNKLNPSILFNEFKIATSLQKVDTIILDCPVREFSSHRQFILEKIYENRKNYDLVITPCEFDTHQDHKVIYEEACRVFRNTNMLGYELPWNHVNFKSPLFVKLSEEEMYKKWNAISCYQSQIEMNRSYFSKDFIYGLARVRGVQAGSEYAEMYQFINGSI
jgi:LmbE family N-acetylglucosaminyl deacetylase